MNTYTITKRANKYIATRGNANIFVSLGNLSNFVRDQKSKGFDCEMAK